LKEKNLATEAPRENVSNGFKHERRTSKLRKRTLKKETNKLEGQQFTDFRRSWGSPSGQNAAARHVGEKDRGGKPKPHFIEGVIGHPVLERQLERQDDTVQDDQKHHEKVPGHLARPVGIQNALQKASVLQVAIYVLKMEGTNCNTLVIQKTLEGSLPKIII